MADKAKWTIDKRLVTASTEPDGTQTATLPLLDDGVRVGHLLLSMSPDRALRVEWQAEAGAVPLSGFTAWEKA